MRIRSELLTVLQWTEDVFDTQYQALRDQYFPLKSLMQLRMANVNAQNRIRELDLKPLSENVATDVITPENFGPSCT
jgi:hypothetical protein